MIITYKSTRYVAAILFVTLVCCIFCISSVGAAETPSSLLKNPFSSSSSPSSGATSAAPSPSSGATSAGKVVAPASKPSATVDSCRIILQTDRTRVYYQGKIQFDATVVRTSTNAPAAAVSVTFQNLNDSFETKRAVTNSQGKAVAGAYAKLEPPQSEQWIATAIVDGMECSSKPVNVQVMDFNAPAITADSFIYVNPFSTGGIYPLYAIADAFWPYSYYNPAFTGFINPDAWANAWTYESNGWTVTAGWFPWAYYPSYYPYWSTYSSESRPFFSVASTSPVPVWP